jgi:murein DD-endopeptidase MepM/ murein hydrolase activator NlpD
MRRNPFTKAADFHAGLDLAAPPGTPVHATAAGVVVFAGRYDLRQSVGWWRYGNLVMVRHGDRFVSLYGHCQDVQVRVGQRVEQGQTIATVGNTGWSTSPHLHYEVRRRDAAEYRPIDPRIYILDHRWRDEERLLVRARSAPDPGDYEPLPSSFGR